MDRLFLSIPLTLKLMNIDILLRISFLESKDKMVIQAMIGRLTEKLAYKKRCLIKTS